MRHEVLVLAALPEGSAAPPPRNVARILDLAAKAGLRAEELKVEGTLTGTRVWRIRREDEPLEAEVLLVHWFTAQTVGPSEHLTVYAHNPRTGRRREVSVSVLRYTMKNIADGRMHDG